MARKDNLRNRKLARILQCSYVLQNAAGLHLATD